MSESERPATAQGSDFGGDGLGRPSRELGGKVRDGALARLQLRTDAVGEETVDHVGAFGELNVEPGRNGRAIDAAVEDRLDRCAQFALGARRGTLPVHDRVEQRRAFAQGRRVVQRQHFRRAAQTMTFARS